MKQRKRNEKTIKLFHNKNYILLSAHLAIINRAMLRQLSIRAAWQLQNNETKFIFISHVSRLDCARWFWHKRFVQSSTINLRNHFWITLKLLEVTCISWELKWVTNSLSVIDFYEKSGKSSYQMMEKDGCVPTNNAIIQASLRCL